MRLSANSKQDISVYLAAVCLPLCACCLVFWGPDVNALLLVGSIGTVALLTIAVLAPETFIVVLLATKPFIDLTWNHPFFSFGGFSASALHVTGFCVLIVAGYLYFFRNDGRAIFNERLIWLFLLLNLMTGFIAVCFESRPLIDVLDTIVKLFDGYFIYFIGHRFLHDEKSKLRIIGIIWITTFLINILSIAQYFTGIFEIDVSQGVERFAGLYNDPGTPSYNAIISLVFGTLYIEILRKGHRIVSNTVSIAFALTVIIAVLTLKITVTKSALLMLIAFMVMWFGSYKRKSYIVIPLLIVGAFYIYTTSEAIQSRIAPELEFLAKSGRSMEEARHIGEGRIAVWERLLIHYAGEYDLLQKLFGTSRSFSAHNQYIAYLMDVGFVGLTVFLMIVLRFYRQLIHMLRVNRQPDVYMGVVLLTLFLLVGLAGHPFYYTTILWYLMIMLSIVNVEFVEPAHRTKTVSTSPMLESSCHKQGG